jgi:hypothetical protein
VKKTENSSGIASIKVMTQRKTLTLEEERVMRMRAGISLPPESRLESKLDGLNETVRMDAEARLALIQEEVMNTMSTYRQAELMIAMSTYKKAEVMRVMSTHGETAVINQMPTDCDVDDERRSRIVASLRALVSQE